MDNQEQAQAVGALQQPHDELSAAICFRILAELEQAKRKYQPLFQSSCEAHGSLRQEFLEVESELVTVKFVDGKFLDKVSGDNSRFLEAELIQLAAMCIKTIISCCVDSPETKDALRFIREGLANTK